MSNAQKLQNLVERIPALASSQVVFKPGHGYYVEDGSSPIFFERADIGERWLSEWISTGVRPDAAKLRLGANQRRQVDEVDQQPETESEKVRRGLASGENRARRVKQGQIEVGIGGRVDLQHDDPLGRSWSHVTVDSAAFQAWLTAAKSFTVNIPIASFVVRNETRRGKSGWWYAYFKTTDRKLHKRYIGKSEAVTWARLVEIAGEFSALENPVMARFGRG